MWILSVIVRRVTDSYQIYFFSFIFFFIWQKANILFSVLDLTQRISCLAQICTWYQLQNRQWAIQGISSFPYFTKIFKI